MAFAPTCANTGTPRVLSIVVNPVDGRNVAVNPRDPQTLFAAIGDATPAETGAVMPSRDTGQTWETLPLDAEPNSMMWRVTIQADDPDVVYAASRFGYLYRSDNGGDSWHKLRREFSEIADVAWFPRG